MVLALESRERMTPYEVDIHHIAPHHRYVRSSTSNLRVQVLIADGGLTLENIEERAPLTAESF